MGRFLASEDDFSSFYRSNAQPLVRFFVKRTFDAQVALDLTAETFAQAFASRRTFRGSGNKEATSWLFTIARRQLAHYFEDGNVRRKLSRRLIGGAVVASDEDVARIEELASLKHAREVLRGELQALERGQREALWLRIVEEQPYATVARNLGISEQTARQRVSRALRVLASPALSDAK